MLKKKIFVALVAFFSFFSLESINAFADEINTDTASSEMPVVIGQYDGLLSEHWNPNTPMPAAVSNVRINSYATYHSTDGIQVNVRLYVPMLEYPKPQFTSMVGNVNVNLNNNYTNKTFIKGANGTATIETDVNTGVKGKSGNKGVVSISGTAYALNAINNGGVFSISYNVTIP